MLGIMLRCVLSVHGRLGACVPLAYVSGAPPLDVMCSLHQAGPGSVHPPRPAQPRRHERDAEAVRQGGLGRSGVGRERAWVVKAEGRTAGQQPGCLRYASVQAIASHASAPPLHHPICCCAQVPSFDSGVAMELINQELGRPWQEVYSELRCGARMLRWGALAQGMAEGEVDRRFDMVVAG